MSIFPLEKNDYEVDSTDAICPNCGNHQYIEMGDLPTGTNDGYSWEETCDKCETKFKVILSISTHFTSEWKQEAKP